MLEGDGEGERGRVAELYGPVGLETGDVKYQVS